MRNGNDKGLKLLWSCLSEEIKKFSFVDASNINF